MTYKAYNKVAELQARRAVPLEWMATLSDPEMKTLERCIGKAGRNVAVLEEALDFFG